MKIYLWLIIFIGAVSFISIITPANAENRHTGNHYEYIINIDYDRNVYQNEYNYDYSAESGAIGISASGLQFDKNITDLQVGMSLGYYNAPNSGPESYAITFGAAQRICIPQRNKCGMINGSFSSSIRGATAVNAAVNWSL